MTDESTARLAEVLKDRGGPGLIFVELRQQAQELAGALTQRLGYEVEWVTAERSLSTRKALAERMRQGSLKLAVCTSTWSTGLDIPALEYVVLTGRGKAPIGALQSVGRALRVQGDKRFEVINCIESGLTSAAVERNKVLASQGFEVDESTFLSELDNERQREANRQPTLCESVGINRDSVMYFLKLVGVGFALQALIELLS